MDSVQENKEEKKFFIEVTNYTNKEVSKGEYHLHLTNKLNTRYDMLMDLKIKQKKLEEEIKSMESRVTTVAKEISSLVGKERVVKDFEYAEWRFEEMNKRKASKLPLKEITSSLVRSLQ